MRNLDSVGIKKANESPHGKDYEAFYHCVLHALRFNFAQQVHLYVVLKYFRSKLRENWSPQRLNKLMSRKELFFCVSK